MPLKSNSSKTNESQNKLKNWRGFYKRTAHSLHYHSPGSLRENWFLLSTKKFSSVPCPFETRNVHLLSAFRFEVLFIFEHSGKLDLRVRNNFALIARSFLELVQVRIKVLTNFSKFSNLLKHPAARVKIFCPLLRLCLCNCLGAILGKKWAFGEPQKFWLSHISMSLHPLVPKTFRNTERWSSDRKTLGTDPIWGPLGSRMDSKGDRFDLRLFQNRVPGPRIDPCWCKIQAFHKIGTDMEPN